MFYLSVLSIVPWLFVLLVPWRVWRIDDRLTVDYSLVANPDPLSAVMTAETDSRPACEWTLSLEPRDGQLRTMSRGELDYDMSVLIPARNEAKCIEATLHALRAQRMRLQVIVIDDQSDDGTGLLVRRVAMRFTQIDSPVRIQIVDGRPLPPGWTGKLHALEQGLKHVRSDRLLLLDADIHLGPRVLCGLLKQWQLQGGGMVSVMATLSTSGFWDRLLLPPFVYFFKLIYPFSLVRKARSGVAAAAGGCILLDRHILDRIGGFAVVKDALIDDCSLARVFKRNGAPLWLGLSDLIVSRRQMSGLSDIWNMVARTAFTQLRESIVLLLLCTAAMLFCFVLPVLCVAASLIFAGDAAMVPSALLGLAALVCMVISYVPLIRYYRLSALWTLALVPAACFFLLFTWSSAIRFWRGERSRWKGRVYDAVA